MQVQPFGALRWGLAVAVANYLVAGDAGRARLRLTTNIQIPCPHCSLKSNIPFSLDGLLGFYMRGANLTATARGAAGGSSGSTSGSGSGSSSAVAGQQQQQHPGLGDLEIQFESSSPSAYTISQSSTLR